MISSKKPTCCVLELNVDFSLVTVTLLRVTVPLPKSKLSPTRRMFLSVMYSVSVWSVFGSELSEIVS
ncbi:MAG: hypothetical protein II012_01290 [Ruminococcus sp.]|nr:hypothetical protein [Ruminococcus sp.]